MVVGGIALWPDGGAVPFSLSVTPQRLQAIVGQRVVLLARATDRDGGRDGGPVRIAARAEGATVAVSPLTISGGRVAEVTAVPSHPTAAGPGPAGVGQLGPGGIEPIATVHVVVTATREGIVRSRTVTIDVIEWEDTLGPEAAVLRDRFVAWLAADRPDLGITADTEWTGTIVKPGILEVMHYLFFSSDWEMGLTWHVMIPPYNWARIYLRPRAEAAPTLAFEISSVSDASVEPHPMAAPAEIDR
jgi:hypothetical protein